MISKKKLTMEYSHLIFSIANFLILEEHTTQTKIFQYIKTK